MATKRKREDDEDGHEIKRAKNNSLTLIDLDKDTMTIIMSMLGNRDLTKLCSLNKYLNSFTKIDHLWVSHKKEVYKFSEELLWKEKEDWMQNYINYCDAQLKGRRDKHIIITKGYNNVKTTYLKMINLVEFLLYHDYIRQRYYNDN